MNIPSIEGTVSDEEWRLRVELAALGLSPRVLNRLRHIAGSKVTKDRAALVLKDQ